MDEHFTYSEHVEVRRKWVRGAEAEFAGIVSAQWPNAPPRYSSDPYLQSRFEQGRQDGKTALMLDEERRGKP